MPPCHRTHALVLALPLAVAFAGCSDAVATMEREATARLARPEIADDAIQLQLVLIGCAGSIQNATRSNDAAKARAAEVYALAKGGADFDTLVQQFSDDPTGGMLTIARAERSSVIPAIGDIGFRLAVGEVGVAPFDPTTCKFGWLILKRHK